jgi:hypothetical protein
MSQNQLSAKAKMSGKNDTMKPPNTTGFFLPILSEMKPRIGWRIMLLIPVKSVNKPRTSTLPPRFKTYRDQKDQIK